jgi:DNA-binding beta-propeller fold protein YncE
MSAEASKKGRAVRVGSRFTVTNRQALTALAIILALFLAGLILYLLLSVPQEGLRSLGGEPVAGIEPLFAIEGPGVGDRPTFDRPLGVAVGEDGRIWVADSGNDRIAVFDEDGEFLFEFGGTGRLKPTAEGDPTWEGGRFDFPTGIDIDENGFVYVADFRNTQIQVFDEQGEFVRAFPDTDAPTGKGSSGAGGGIAVTDVSAADGRVFATDEFQVFEFTSEGVLERQFGKPGPEPEDLDRPNGLAIAEDGIVYVSDSNHHRVTAFAGDGSVVWSVGRTPEGLSDTGDREFGLPRGLAVMEDGTIVVADAFDFQLVRISSDGEILSEHGRRGEELGELNYPNDVDARGDILVVADKENDRVQVLRLIEE